MYMLVKNRAEAGNHCAYYYIPNMGSPPHTPGICLFGMLDKQYWPHYTGRFLRNTFLAHKAHIQMPTPAGITASQNILIGQHGPVASTD